MNIKIFVADSYMVRHLQLKSPVFCAASTGDDYVFCGGNRFLFKFRKATGYTRSLEVPDKVTQICIAGSEWLFTATDEAPFVVRKYTQESLSLQHTYDEHSSPIKALIYFDLCRVIFAGSQSLVLLNIDDVQGNQTITQGAQPSCAAIADQLSFFVAFNDHSLGFYTLNNAVGREVWRTKLAFAFSAMACDTNGKTLYAACESLILRYELKPLQLVSTYDIHIAPITSLACEDTGRLFSAALDGRVWAVEPLYRRASLIKESGKPVWQLQVVLENLLISSEDRLLRIQKIRLLDRKAGTYTTEALTEMQENYFKLSSSVEAKGSSEVKEGAESITIPAKLLGSESIKHHRLLVKGSFSDHSTPRSPPKRSSPIHKGRVVSNLGTVNSPQAVEKPKQESNPPTPKKIERVEPAGYLFTQGCRIEGIIKNYQMLRNKVVVKTRLEGIEITVSGSLIGSSGIPSKDISPHMIKMGCVVIQPIIPKSFDCFLFSGFARMFFQHGNSIRGVVYKNRLAADESNNGSTLFFQGKFFTIVAFHSPEELVTHEGVKVLVDYHTGEIMLGEASN